MDGAAFDTYVRTQLAPSLAPGDAVILDNLNVHKSPRAAKAVAGRGAWLLGAALAAALRRHRRHATSLGDISRHLASDAHAVLLLN
jgi:hypothetical protein